MKLARGLNVRTVGGLRPFRFVVYAEIGMGMVNAKNWVEAQMLIEKRIGKIAHMRY